MGLNCLQVPAMLIFPHGLRNRLMSTVLHCPFHSVLRISCELLLQGSRERIGQTCRRTRTGKCIKIVPDALVGSVKFHRKTLFAALAMSWQSSIGEAESFASSVLNDFVNDTASIQGPKPEMRNEDSDRGVSFKGRVRPAQLDPWHVEHLPLSDRFLRLLKDVGSFAQLNAVVIDVVPIGCAFSGRSHMGIRKLLISLHRNKLADGVS